MLGIVKFKSCYLILLEDELLKVCRELTPLEWAKQYAAKRSAEEKDSKKDIMLKYSSSTLIKKAAVA